MPRYKHHCNACAYDFEVLRSMGDRSPVECPECCASSTGVYYDKDGVRHDLVERIFSPVQQIRDIDHANGNTGDPVFMPAYGKHVGSRRQLTEERERAREDYFNRTGIDMGPIGSADEKPVHVRETSPFDPTKTPEEHMAELSKKLGVDPKEEQRQIAEAMKAYPEIAAHEELGTGSVMLSDAERAGV